MLRTGGDVSGLLGQAQRLLARAEVEEAAGVAVKALEAASRVGGVEGEVESLLMLFRVHYLKGDEVTARDVALGALKLARDAERADLTHRAQDALLSLYGGALALQTLLAGVRNRLQRDGIRCGPFPPILAPTLEAR